MRFIGQSLLEGVRDLGHDPSLGQLLIVTIRLALESTAIALVIGLPLACVLGLGHSRATRWGTIVANIGLGLPPVAIGVYARLLLDAGGVQPPWGGTWLDSLNGMVLCQTLIALPIVVALGAVAIRSLPGALIEQARAFGAAGPRLGLLALREARLGIVAATIVALGSAIGEVGAITMITATFGPTQTLATQLIQDSYQRQPARQVEHALVLLAMLAVLGAALVLSRRSGLRARRRDARARRAVAVGAAP